MFVCVIVSQTAIEYSNTRSIISVILFGCSYLDFTMMKYYCIM